jgi:trehalose-6-phosphate synthase
MNFMLEEHPILNRKIDNAEFFHYFDNKTIKRLTHEEMQGFKQRLKKYHNYRDYNNNIGQVDYDL